MLFFMLISYWQWWCVIESLKLSNQQTNWKQETSEGNGL